MNKKIMLICSTVLSAVIFTTGVYASQMIESATNVASLSETAQLQSALDNSNVLRSRYNVTSHEEELAELDNDGVQTYSLRATEDVTDAPNAENAIKVYNVDLSESTTSLLEQLNVEPELRLLSEVINDETAFVFMKKGQSIDVATEKINALNISSERKEKMISKATEKAGKWYVSCIKRYGASVNADDFVDKSSVLNLLNSNNFSDVKDMKYVYITNNEMLGIWVKTEDAEHIVPFVTTSRTDNLSGNNVYTLSDIVDYIVE